MRKFNIYAAGAMVVLGAAFTSCDKVDCDNCGKPVVPEVTVTLTGKVTDINGNALGGAVVKAGDLTATADANGIYTFNDMKEGSYNMTASNNNYVTAYGDVNIVKSDNSQTYIWDAALNKYIQSDVNVTVAGGGQGSVTSEAINGNDEGEVNISVNVPEGSTSKDVKIYIVPIYTDYVSKAASDELLIGADIECTDPTVTVLNNPMDVNFKLDDSAKNGVTVKELQNGNWVTVNHDVTADGITVKTKNLSSIGLFFNVDVTKSSASQSLFYHDYDNLSGYTDIHVGNLPFEYKVGADFEVNPRNTIQGLLIEYLNRIFGARTSTVQKGNYDINTNVSAGWGLSVSIRQAIETTKVSALGNSVSGKKYGTVTTITIPYQGNHNGGAN